MFVSLSVEGNVLVEEQEAGEDKYSVENIEECVVKVSVDSQARKTVSQVGHQDWHHEKLRLEQGNA